MERRLVLVKEPGEHERVAAAPTYIPTQEEKAWFDEQVRDVTPLLRAVALRQCRHQADAEDLLQTTFESALRHLDRFDRWLTTHRRLVWATLVLVCLAVSAVYFLAVARGEAQLRIFIERY